MSKALTSCRAALNAFSRSSAPTTAAELAIRLVPRYTPHRPRRTYGTSTPRRNAEPSRHTYPTESSSKTEPDPSRLVRHLDDLFSPLQFPPELAARILTHASHKDAVISHNARLSFIGRRVVKTYLLLFLHSSPALTPAHDYDLTLEKTLNTYILGEHVAPKWGLGRVLKWSPVNISPDVVKVQDDYSRMSEKLSQSVGLYKVMGTTVEAVVGGVFHQHGGAVAHRLFHTRLLPHLLLPGRPEGLHDAFHANALDICERMGGVDGPLVIAPSSAYEQAKSRPQKVASSS